MAKKIKQTEAIQKAMDALAKAKKEQTENRKKYDELVNQTIPKASDKLLKLSAALSEAKKDVFELFKEVLQLKYLVYETTDEQKNDQFTHTFSNDEYSIKIGSRTIESWNDTAQDGIAKVNAFIDSLATDKNSHALVKTVKRLLKQDKTGNLSASRVLELERIADEFNNAEFTDGVTIIRNALKTTRSCWFIEAYQFNGLNQKVSLPLSISAVDFPEGFDFSF